MGRIRKWNELFNGRGNCTGNEGRVTDQVEDSFWNKKSKWKVYSSHTKKKDKEAVKGKAGKVWGENSDFDYWHELEDQCIDSRQSSYDSSSNNSESDKEAMEVEEMNIVDIREAMKKRVLRGQDIYRIRRLWSWRDKKQKRVKWLRDLWM